MDSIATYIHHIDPIIFDINGTLAIRWYGLAYVAGFALGYLTLRQLSRRGLYSVGEEQLGDFITAVCIFGVLLGGRLGEFFFYWLPEHGLSGLAEDPLWVLRVYEGGMASHGGILGVILVALWYSRKHKRSFPSVLDGLAIVAPIGLCFGRIANFINGELYGSIAPADSSIAVKFPQELFTLPQEVQIQATAAATHAAGQDWTHTYEGLMSMIRDNEAFREALGAFLNPRYPSQLFEALGEGLLIFAVLLTLRLKWKTAPAGIFCAIFGLMYAAARITCECYKEPDAAVWYGVTEGQALSLGIAVIGLAFLITALREKRQKNPQITKKDLQ